jgi:hypothetical protein
VPVECAHKKGRGALKPAIVQALEQRGMLRIDVMVGRPMDTYCAEVQGLLMRLHPVS